MSKSFRNVVNTDDFAKRTGIKNGSYPDVRERTAEHKRTRNYKSRGNYATGGYCGKPLCVNRDMLCDRCIRWDKYKEGRGE